MDALFRELLDVLGSQAAGEPLGRFVTRQLHERVSGERLDKPRQDWAHVRISEDEIDVEAESWPLEELLKFPKWHPRDKPRRVDVALVVFRGWGQECLIDGQTRVNFWQAQGAAGPHRVLVMKPRRDVADPFPN